MVLLEMSVVPVGTGEHLSKYIAQCVDLIDKSGLDYELHSMGTIVEGELPQVLDVLKQCMEKMAEHSDRVTCTARLDYRAGVSGAIKSKVESVAKELGRPVRS